MLHILLPNVAMFSDIKNQQYENLGVIKIECVPTSYIERI